METQKLEKLEELLKQREQEIAFWKAHSRKWEERSKRNYAARQRLQRELIRVEMSQRTSSRGGSNDDQ